MRLVRFLHLAALLATLLALGCEREDEIRTYEAPKERAPVAVNDAPPPAPADESPTFTVPAGWKDMGGQGMRFASFQVSPDDPTALVTVVPLGRDSGDLHSNVARWQGQVGLPPAGADELSKVTKQIDVNGVPVTTVDLRGEKLWTRAAVVPRGPRIWFFKLTGDAKVVEREASNFDAFVQSIRFSGTSQQPPSESRGPATAPGGPKWDVPAGWAKQPDRPMRFATFRAGESDNAPEVVVSSFGAFGTMKDNINRWRNMVGLEPVGDEKEQPVEKTTIAGHDAALFDMTGPAKDGQPAKRLVLAMVPVGEQVWFFRMLGPVDAVQQQRANFDALLKSVTFDN